MELEAISEDLINRLDQTSPCHSLDTSSEREHMSSVTMGDEIGDTGRNTGDSPSISIAHLQTHIAYLTQQKAYLEAIIQKAGIEEVPTPTFIKPELDTPISQTKKGDFPEIDHLNEYMSKLFLIVETDQLFLKEKVRVTSQTFSTPSHKKYIDFALETIEGYENLKKETTSELAAKDLELLMKDTNMQAMENQVGEVFHEVKEFAKEFGAEVNEDVTDVTSVKKLLDYVRGAFKSQATDGAQKNILIMSLKMRFMLFSKEWATTTKISKKISTENAYLKDLICAYRNRMEILVRNSTPEDDPIHNLSNSA